MKQGTSHFLNQTSHFYQESSRGQVTEKKIWVNPDLLEFDGTQDLI